MIPVGTLATAQIKIRIPLGFVYPLINEPNGIGNGSRAPIVTIETHQTRRVKTVATVLVASAAKVALSQRTKKSKHRTEPLEGVHAPGRVSNCNLLLGWRSVATEDYNPSHWLKK